MDVLRVLLNAGHINLKEFNELSQYPWNLEDFSSIYSLMIPILENYLPLINRYK